MEPHDYIVTDIQGDYAILTQTDAESAEPFTVALALLPPETDTAQSCTALWECLRSSAKGGSQ